MHDAKVTQPTVQFTPGPWHVDASYDIPSVIADCFPKGATCVAVVYGDDDAIMARVTGSNVADCTPNARLIASAPELLAVCRYLVQVADKLGYSGESYARAKAAIAKAEGGAM